MYSVTGYPCHACRPQSRREVWVLVVPGGHRCEKFLSVVFDCVLCLLHVAGGTGCLGCWCYQAPGCHQVQLALAKALVVSKLFMISGDAGGISFLEPWTESLAMHTGSHSAKGMAAEPSCATPDTSRVNRAEKRSCNNLAVLSSGESIR